MLTPLDQVDSAWLDDPNESRMLDQTMVLVLGQFGRTPKVNNGSGRDHWGSCFKSLFAGAGVLGGKVVGHSDDIGADPTSAAFSPDDIGATVYTALGIDPHAVVHGRINRPVHLNQGTVVEALYSDVSV